MHDDPDPTGYGDPAPAGHNNPPTYEEELRQGHAELFLRLEALKLSRARLPSVVNDDDGLASVGTFIKNARELAKDADAAHKKVSKEFAEKKKTCDKVFLSGGLAGAVSDLVSVVKALADDYTERKEKERRRQLEAEAQRLRDLEGEKQYEVQSLAEAGSHNAAEVAESQAEHTAKRADRLETKAEGKVADVVRTSFGNVTASGRTLWAYEVEDLEKVDLNVLKGVFLDHELHQVFQRYVDRGGRDLKGLRIFPKTVATFR